jgi:hypothetical protein
VHELAGSELSIANLAPLSPGLCFCRVAAGDNSLRHYGYGRSRHNSSQNDENLLAEMAIFAQK